MSRISHLHNALTRRILVLDGAMGTMVGRIGPDQVADYAKRRGITMEVAERWLAPNLSYETMPAGAGCGG